MDTLIQDNNKKNNCWINLSKKELSRLMTLHTFTLLYFNFLLSATNFMQFTSDLDV